MMLLVMLSIAYGDVRTMLLGPRIPDRSPLLALLAGPRNRAA